MKKTFTIMIFFLALVLTGCSYPLESTKGYTFQGENENWIGVYEENRTVTFPKKEGNLYCKNWKEATLSVTYKNDLSRLSHIRHFKIEYWDGSSGGSSYENLDSSLKRKTFKLGGGSGTSSQISNSPPKSEVFVQYLFLYSGLNIRSGAESIPVTISFDGNKETIVLHQLEPNSSQEVLKDLRRWFTKKPQQRNVSVT